MDRVLDMILHPSDMFEGLSEVSSEDSYQNLQLPKALVAEFRKESANKLFNRLAPEVSRVRKSEILRLNKSKPKTKTTFVSSTPVNLLKYRTSSDSMASPISPIGKSRTCIQNLQSVKKHIKGHSKKSKQKKNVNSSVMEVIHHLENLSQSRKSSNKTNNSLFQNNKQDNCAVKEGKRLLVERQTQTTDSLKKLTKKSRLKDITNNNAYNPNEEENGDTPSPENHFESQEVVDISVDDLLKQFDAEFSNSANTIISISSTSTNKLLNLSSFKRSASIRTEPVTEVNKTNLEVSLQLKDNEQGQEKDIGDINNLNSAVNDCNEVSIPNMMDTNLDQEEPVEDEGIVETAIINENSETSAIIETQNRKRGRPRGKTINRYLTDKTIMTRSSVERNLEDNTGIIQMHYDKSDNNTASTDGRLKRRCKPPLLYVQATILTDNGLIKKLNAKNKQSRKPKNNSESDLLKTHQKAKDAKIQQLKTREKMGGRATGRNDIQQSKTLKNNRQHTKDIVITQQPKEYNKERKRKAINPKNEMKTLKNKKQKVSNACEELQVTNENDGQENHDNCPDSGVQLEIVEFNSRPEHNRSNVTNNVNVNEGITPTFTANENAVVSSIPDLNTQCSDNDYILHTVVNNRSIVEESPQKPTISSSKSNKSKQSRVSEISVYSSSKRRSIRIMNQKGLEQSQINTKKRASTQHAGNQLKAIESNIITNKNISNGATFSTPQNLPSNIETEEQPRFSSSNNVNVNDNDDHVPITVPSDDITFNKGNDSSVCNTVYNNMLHIVVKNEVIGLEWFGSLLQTNSESDKLSVKYGLKNLKLHNSLVSTGSLRIPPSQQKPLQITKKHEIIYTVIEGEAIVKVQGKVKNATTDSTFCIPLGVEYCIKNRSATQLLLLHFVKLCIV